MGAFRFNVKSDSNRNVVLCGVHAFVLYESNIYKVLGIGSTFYPVTGPGLFYLLVSKCILNVKKCSIMKKNYRGNLEK